MGHCSQLLLYSVSHVGFCVFVFPFFYLFFLFALYRATVIMVVVSPVIFLVFKALGILAALFFTTQAFRRQHSQGAKIWAAFWMALPLEIFFLSLFDGLLGAIIPYYALVQIARFILVWMLIAQVAGEHVLGIFKSAGLLSQ